MKGNLEKKGAQKKKAKRKGSEVILGNTRLYQPNRVTNAEFPGFTLIRVRCFLAIMKHLQEAVKLDMSGQDWTQLSFFDNSPALVPYPGPTHDYAQDSFKQGVVRIQIELSEIGPPEQYQDIYQALDSFRFISLKLEPPKGFKRSNANIAARVDESELIGGKSYVSMYLLQEVVNQLVLTTKDHEGKPQQYTSYLYEVALSFRGKYTALLYFLLNSWKIKGIFTMPLEKLRKQLGLGEDEYKEYSDFKRRILLPAATEMLQHPGAECYFDPDPADKDDLFEIRNGKQVTALRIKVFTRDAEEAKLTGNTENIKYFLRNHGFVEKHLEMLKPIYSQTTAAKVQAEYLRVMDKIKDNDGKDAKGITIVDYAAYLTSCFLTAFGGQGLQLQVISKE